jgi:hypothetical protein
MTRLNIIAIIIVLSGSLLIASPSALKYWYSGVDSLFIFMLSGIKCLTSLFSTGRLRLNQVGVTQYTAKSPHTAKIQRIILSVFKESIKYRHVIIPTPVAADFRITFRSLLKNLFIMSSRFLRFIHSAIIARKALQVSLFLAITLVFANYSALANEECLAAIDKYEQLYKIPTGLLKAVGKVESEYNFLALNDGLGSHNFKTKQEVLNRINYLVDIGKTNFDIGCMQINYYWHRKNFNSIEEMLNVSWNVRYAASLIHGLYKEHGTWQAAVRHYHSYEPSIHKQYSKKIALAWLKEK